ncbi:hypothetical protein TNCT_29391 [Trichonephila clavata]|uniref:Uncharacterized protein n=1 Tax=Trichonephila clavata TaxID=2740835 RepID=A0A8X6IPT6_TRICU|nr:hypothetical protein TNCT_29391 [Trichonephila clavata]
MVWVMNHKSETNPSKTTPFYQVAAFDSERPLVRDCNEREFCHSMELIPVFIKDRHFHSPNRTYAGYSFISAFEQSTKIGEVWGFRETQELEHHQ